MLHKVVTELLVSSFPLSLGSLKLSHASRQESSFLLCTLGLSGYLFSRTFFQPEVFGRCFIVFLQKAYRFVVIKETNISKEERPFDSKTLIVQIWLLQACKQGSKQRQTKKIWYTPHAFLCFSSASERRLTVHFFNNNSAKVFFYDVSIELVKLFVLEAWVSGVQPRHFG